MMQRRMGSLAPVDMPLGERIEQYSVTIAGVTQSLEYSCPAPSITVPEADLLTLGGGAASIIVKQIGDWGASRPATTQITLS
jgi:hypothetical protein